MLKPLVHLRPACSPYAHRSQKITAQWLSRTEDKQRRSTKISHPTQLLTVMNGMHWYNKPECTQFTTTPRQIPVASQVMMGALFISSSGRNVYHMYNGTTAQWNSTPFSTNCTNHAPVYLTSTIRYVPTATGHGAAFSVVWGASEHAQGWALGAPSCARSLPAFRSAFGASLARRGEMRRSL